MKRFKVVQDARGNWGIHNTTDRWHEGSFASWGKHYPIDDIVKCAVRLNAGVMQVRDFHWTWYYPREQSK